MIQVCPECKGDGTVSIPDRFNELVPIVCNRCMGTGLIKVFEISVDVPYSPYALIGCTKNNEHYKISKETIEFQRSLQEKINKRLRNKQS